MPRRLVSTTKPVTGAPQLLSRLLQPADELGRRMAVGGHADLLLIEPHRRARLGPQKAVDFVGGGGWGGGGVRRFCMSIPVSGERGSSSAGGPCMTGGPPAICWARMATDSA